MTVYLINTVEATDPAIIVGIYTVINIEGMFYYRRNQTSGRMYFNRWTQTFFSDIIFPRECYSFDKGVKI